MRIIVEIKGDKDALLQGYDSMRELLNKLVKDDGIEIKVSEPKESNVEIPPEVTSWFLRRKEEFSGRDIALVILNLRYPEALTKDDMGREAERIGVNVRRFHDWLDKTFMSPHGPMKGLIVSTQSDSRTRLYSLTPYGLERASKLMKDISEEYTRLRS